LWHLNRSQLLRLDQNLRFNAAHKGLHKRHKKAILSTSHVSNNKA
jgi:virulence-associated protein VagC